MKEIVVHLFERVTGYERKQLGEVWAFYFWLTRSRRRAYWLTLKARNAAV